MTARSVIETTHTSAPPPHKESSRTVLQSSAQTPASRARTDDVRQDAALTSQADEEPLPRLLDPEHLARVEAVYQNLINKQFAFEIRLSHFLAYIRTWASPSVVGLLAHTGHVQNAPRKRATDTGLYMYELFEAGLDSPKGEQIIRELRRAHHHWRISNQDYIWILGTFCVLGPQIIDRYAWRRLTDDERQAGVDWWRELGTRMSVVDIPTTYADFVDAFRDYELRNLRHTDKGQAMFDVSWPILLERLPAAVRPMARQMTAVLTDEPARRALGLPTPNMLTRTAVTTALLGRSVLQRDSDVPVEMQFTPGAPVDPYPSGYRIEDLGVGQDHVHPAVARTHQARTGVVEAR